MPCAQAKELFVPGIINNFLQCSEINKGRMSTKPCQKNFVNYIVKIKNTIPY